jgi:hypothetical protein
MAGMRRHAVHDPAGRRDDAVAAFFLHAGQAAQEFVGDVLAKSCLAEDRAGNLEALGAQHLGDVRCLPAVLPGEFERRDRRVVDATAVVVEARHFEPVALRIDHPPPREVVERGSPQYGLLAARVHCDVAADDGCVRGRRVDREDEAGRMSSLLDATRDHTRFGEQRGDRLGNARQCRRLDAIDALELLDVDDRRKRRERHGAAGVSRAAAARNDG